MFRVRGEQGHERIHALRQLHEKSSGAGFKGIDDTILFKDIGIGEMEKLEIPVDDSIPESELIEIDSELSSSEDEEL